LSRPLAGVRVLDLSRVLAGPYCTMMLGDLGAEVIKVEQPGAGDETRRWGPPFVGGESAYYLAVNRNKKSVTVNLKDDTGKEIVRSLARVSDIVVENFKVGALDRMAIGYAAISNDNPGLLWCSITGYGPHGPYADMPAYDFVIQGEAGVMSITGEPGGEPMKVGVAIVDITAGLFACNAILAALYARGITGQGQRIDVPLFNSAVAWLANVGSNYLVSGEVPGRYGNAHPNIVPYQAFRTADGWMTVAVGTDAQFAALCRVLGLVHLTGDPRFRNNEARVENRGDLIPLLQGVLETETAAAWIQRMKAAGIPCGPINTVDKVFSHPQVVHQRMVTDVPHPTAGSVKVAGPPYTLSSAPFGVPTHPPLLGEHTDEILEGVLGFSPDEVASLRDAGTV
jgi:formyl-CoA transferase